MPATLRYAVALLAGFFACGLPLWPIPYAEVSMPGNPSPAVWLTLGAVAGLLAGWLVERGVVRPVLTVTAGFVLAVMVRVEIETARDPTSHNLWPIEVLIVAVFGLVAGSLGVLLARGLQRVNQRAH